MNDHRGGILMMPRDTSKATALSNKISQLNSKKRDLLNMGKDSGSTKLMGAKILNAWNLSTKDLVSEQEEIDKINRSI